MTRWRVYLAFQACHLFEAILVTTVTEPRSEIEDLCEIGDLWVEMGYSHHPQRARQMQIEFSTSVIMNICIHTIRYHRGKRVTSLFPRGIHEMTQCQLHWVSQGMD